jgi:hypothetical protein
MTRFKRPILASATVWAIVISALVVGGQTNAWACGTTSSGQSAPYVGEGEIAGGTEFTKQPPGCNDFNLVANVSISGVGYGDYAGYYLSGSTEVEGSRGYLRITDRKTQGADIVLLSSVATGTKMWVASENTTASVTVQY